MFFMYKLYIGTVLRTLTCCMADHCRRKQYICLYINNILVILWICILFTQTYFLFLGFFFAYFFFIAGCYRRSYPADSQVPLKDGTD
jgi:hypothetical protein